MREQDLQASVNGVYILEKIPVYGIIRAACALANLPALNTPGYAYGCIMHILGSTTATGAGSVEYRNNGTLTACNFAFAQTNVFP